MVAGSSAACPRGFASSNQPLVGQLHDRGACAPLEGGAVQLPLRLPRHALRLGEVVPRGTGLPLLNQISEKKPLAGRSNRYPHGTLGTVQAFDRSVPDVKWSPCQRAPSPLSN